MRPANGELLAIRPNCCRLTTICVQNLEMAPHLVLRLSAALRYFVPLQLCIWLFRRLVSICFTMLITMLSAMACSSLVFSFVVAPFHYFGASYPRPCTAGCSTGANFSSSRSRSSPGRGGAGSQPELVGVRHLLPERFATGHGLPLHLKRGCNAQPCSFKMQLRVALAGVMGIRQAHVTSV